MKCEIEGCDRNAKTRDMCSIHYRRWWKYGDPNVCKHGEPLRFLNEDVLTYKGEDCLWWPYGRNSRGYGEIIINKAQRNVHVVICEIVHGPRPSPDHVASHKCGKGHLGCVNSRHLQWQTRIEDRADMASHGTVIRGSDITGSKLTEESVLGIRSLAKKLSQREIAEKFGVSQATISAIILRKTWAWL